MPEGPEAHNMAKILNEYLKNQVIVELIITETSRYYKNSFLNYDKMIYPLMILEVRAIGKKILFLLEDPLKIKRALVSSLGMTGQWSLLNTKHSGIILKLKDKDPIYFTDSRHIGKLYYCLENKELTHIFKDTGPDWIDCDITIEAFTKSIKKPRISHLPIGIYLYRQQYFSGIGNYLRAEILYHAKINPHITLKEMTPQSIAILHNSCVYIINKAYEKRGASLYTYKDPLGAEGNFKVQVYNKKIDPLGHPVKADRLNGDDRTIYWVPSVQISLGEPDSL